MAHHLSISNFKRYPPIQAIVLSLLAYLVLEVLCHSFLPTSILEKKFVIIRAQEEALPAPVIQILGDSIAESGILEMLINKSPLVIRNDSIPGSGPAFSYFLLRNQFKHGNVPKILLIAYSPHTFKGSRYSTLIGRFAYFSELPELFWHGGDVYKSTFGFFTRYSYILSYKDEIKLLLLGKSQFFNQSEAHVNKLNRRESIYKNLEQVESGVFMPKQLQNGVRPFLKQDFNVSFINDYYLRKLLNLAKRNEVNVYWITMPFLQRVGEISTHVQYQNDFLSYLKQFEDRGQLSYLAKDFPVYEDRYFDDLIHLNILGAVKFTNTLIPLINTVVDMPVEINVSNKK